MNIGEGKNRDRLRKSKAKAGAGTRQPGAQEVDKDGVVMQMSREENMKRLVMRSIGCVNMRGGGWTVMTLMILVVICGGVATNPRKYDGKTRGIDVNVVENSEKMIVGLGMSARKADMAATLSGGMEAKGINNAGAKKSGEFFVFGLGRGEKTDRLTKREQWMGMWGNACGREWARELGGSAGGFSDVKVVRDMDAVVEREMLMGFGKWVAMVPRQAVAGTGLQRAVVFALPTPPEVVPSAES